MLVVQQDRSQPTHTFQNILTGLPATSMEISCAKNKENV